MVLPHVDGRIIQLLPVRATHRHSVSDSSALRDAATLALLGSQAFAPTAHSLYPPAVTPVPIGLEEHRAVARHPKVNLQTTSVRIVNQISLRAAGHFFGQVFEAT